MYLFKIPKIYLTTQPRGKLLKRQSVWGLFEDSKKAGDIKEEKLKGDRSSCLKIRKKVLENQNCLTSI